MSNRFFLAKDSWAVAIHTVSGFCLYKLVTIPYIGPKTHQNYLDDFWFLIAIHISVLLIVVRWIHISREPMSRSYSNVKSYLMDVPAVSNQMFGGFPYFLWQGPGIDLLAKEARETLKTQKTLLLPTKRSFFIYILNTSYLIGVLLMCIALGYFALYFGFNFGSQPGSRSMSAFFKYPEIRAAFGALLYGFFVFSYASVLFYVLFNRSNGIGKNLEE